MMHTGRCDICGQSIAMMVLITERGLRLPDHSHLLYSANESGVTTTTPFACVCERCARESGREEARLRRQRV